ncbi:peptidase, partial [Staphylococcus aureus]
VHELMVNNTELKVVKLVRSNPFGNAIDEVSFRNEIKDMVQIQQALNRRVIAQDNRYNY